MTIAERQYLTGRIRELAQFVARGRPGLMNFDSEEELLRMLSLEVVPIPATEKPIRLKRKQSQIG